MDNHAYNLIKALAEKAESVEVLEKYSADNTDCEECKGLFGRICAEEKAYVEEFKKLLISHAQKGLIK